MFKGFPNRQNIFYTYTHYIEKNDPLNRHSHWIGFAGAETPKMMMLTSHLCAFGWFLFIACPLFSLFITHGMLVLQWLTEKQRRLMIYRLFIRQLPFTFLVISVSTTRSGIFTQTEVKEEEILLGFLHNLWADPDSRPTFSCSDIAGHHANLLSLPHALINDVQRCYFH